MKSRKSKDTDKTVNMSTPWSGKKTLHRTQD